MKKIKITYFLIAYLTSFTSFRINPLFSSSTILNCNSKVPKGIPCLIKASSYKVEIEKVDICPKNPFPDFRTTPDYAGSLCLNLYDKKNGWLHQTINRANVMAYNADGKKYKEVVIKNF